MKRGPFAAIVAAGLIAPATRTFAQSETRVRFGTVPVESYALAYYAIDRGSFKRAAIDIALSAFTGGGAIASGVAGGALDVGCANVGSLANAHARGLKVRIIAPCALYTTESPTTVLTVAKSSSAQSAKDLNGKTVGVSTLKDLQQASVMRWMEANGGDGKSLKFLELPISTMPAALAAGRVDAGIVLEPTLTFAKAELRIIGKVYDAIAKQLMISAHFAMDDWLEKNAGTARKIAGVLRESAQWANANHAASGAILARVAQIDPSRVEQMNRVIYADKLAPENFQPTIDALAQFGYLPQAFPANELFWVPPTA